MGVRRAAPRADDAPPTTTCCGARRRTPHGLEPVPPPTLYREESRPVKVPVEKKGSAHARLTGRAISRPPQMRPHSDGAAAQWGERSGAVRLRTGSASLRS